MAILNSASPAYILLGADDKGSRPLPITDSGVPQFVPLTFLFTQKGTPKRLLGTGGTAALNYGVDTFLPDGLYHNHATKLAIELYGTGATCIHQRLIPTDAGIKSNIVLYVDLLKTMVPNYVRNSLGDKVIDPITNLPLVDVLTPTIPGTKIKFITEINSLPAMGTLTSKVGTMTDGVTTSTLYPIMEHRAIAQGAHYNNIGYAIESPTTATLDSALVASDKTLSYKLSLVERFTPGGTPQTFRSLYGEPSVECTLKQGVVHPVTSIRSDIKNVFDTNWFRETGPLNQRRYNEYEGMFVYSAYLDSVLTQIMADEKTHITSVAATWNDGIAASTLSWFDFTTDVQTALDAETYLINIFTAKSTGGKDYFTLVIDQTAPTLAAGQKEVSISRTTPVFLGGGSDGTMNNAMFETLVNIEMAKYLDPNSEVIDNAINVESWLIDSGFTLPTKLSLYNFIAVRKDTNVLIGTYDAADGNKIVPLSDARAIGVLLSTRGKLFPESAFYGTGVARAVITAGAYKLHNDLSGNYVPYTFEIALKLSSMMGAGNYKWDASKLFDHGPNAVLQYGYNYQPEFIPAGIKTDIWNVGLVWAQPKDRDTWFTPAVQTIYANDTSPLNNVITIAGLATLNRIASDSWREFTGTSTMTDPEFIDAVTKYINGRLDGIFDGLLTVIPFVIIDAADAQRGYSWKVMFQLYAGNMKTKMVSYSEVYRLTTLAV